MIFDTVDQNKKSDREGTEKSSERGFGLTFSILFLLVGLWFFIESSIGLSLLAVSISTIFALLVWLTPKILELPNIVWTKFGNLLHKIGSPVVLAAIFYFVVTPTALLVRLIGRDHLQLRFQRNADSYWDFRDPPGPDPKSMSDQF